jgi:putative ABC transport system permease protein
MRGRISLAWLQLVAEKRRLLAAVAGITFAAMLMLMQLGFRDALLASATLVHDRLDADLVLISSIYEYLAQSTAFPERRLVQALGAPGVEAVAPVYVTLGTWKNPDTGRDFVALLLGFDVARRTFTLPAVEEQSRTLALPDVVVADTASRPEMGPIADWFGSRGEVVSEFNGRRVTVRGLFQLGTSFGINGNLMTSDLNFARMVPSRPLHMIDVGLIRLAPGVDPIPVRDHLRTALPNDVSVLTREEFVQKERDYWLKASPVGFIFNLGLAIGFIVGAVIVYQILYSDVSDHLAEYATLKAMGYSDLRLTGVVLREAVVLAVLGFIPGLLIAWVLYGFTERETNLAMMMTPARIAGVLLLTVVMCCASGALATRKLRSADPAEIF